MSNLAHKHDPRSSTPSPRRLRALPAPRIASSNALSAGALAAQEHMLAWSEKQVADSKPTRGKPFAKPRLVATLPFAIVAQVSRRRWAVYVSRVERPDVAALLSQLPTHLASAEIDAVKAGDRLSTRQSVLAGLTQLIRVHGGRVPAAAFGEWLRDAATRLRGNTTGLAALGEVVAIAVEEGVLQ